MNDYFQENKRSVLILTALLFILAIVLYFILLRPLMSDLTRKENQITSVQGDIEALEATLADLNANQEEIDIDQLLLEKKIPKEADLDEYILSLQQLELKTDSKIESINFTYDSSLDTGEAEEEIEEAVEDEETIEQEETDTSEEENDSDQSEEEEEAEESSESSEPPTIDPAILNEKPDDLQVMTVKVTGISPTYDDFVELLQAIEESERISIVSNLNFIQPTELDLYFEEDPLETIPFEVELTTFYYDE